MLLPRLVPSVRQSIIRKSPTLPAFPRHVSHTWIKRNIEKPADSMDTSSSPIQPTPFHHLQESREKLIEKEEPIDKRVYSIAVSSMLMGTAIGVIQPVLPKLVESLGIPPSEYGLIISVTFAARLLFNIPSAFLAQKYGRKPLLVGGPLMTSASMLATGVATTTSELVASRFLIGIGGSAQMTGGQLWISDIATPKNRARTIGPMTAAFSAGSIVGPALGGYLATYGTGLPFFVVGGLVALAAVNNSRLPETLPKEKRTSSSLREEVGTTVQQWKDLFSDVNMRAILLLQTALWATAGGCIFTLMPLWATKAWELDPSGLGTIFAIMATINVFGTQAAARLADTKGRKAALVPATILMATSVALLPVIGATSASGMICILALWSVGNTLAGPAPTAYVSDISDSSNRGQALGLLRTAGDLGFLVGAAGAGLLAQFFGVSYTFWTFSGILGMIGANFALRAKESFKKH